MRTLVTLSLMLAFSSVPAVAQTAPRWQADQNAVCGAGTYLRFYDDIRTIDAADTAGDDARVLAITKDGIYRLTICLNSRPAFMPDDVPISLRSEILTYLSFQLNAYSHGSSPQLALSQLQTEARVALDLCNDRALMDDGQPYQRARQAVGFALDRANKIMPAAGSPIEPYREEWRTCAARLGRAVSF